MNPLKNVGVLFWALATEFSIADSLCGDIIPSFRFGKVATPPSGRKAFADISGGAFGILKVLFCMPAHHVPADRFDTKG